ncbi:MAG: pentapeptide repeat-containing protein [Actinomycetota bacterium]|nr:pentapeptide repeat-containing protein [Actinomycetota bacterium]
MRFEPISAEDIIAELTQPLEKRDEAKEPVRPVYTLRHRSVVGKLDLKHRVIEIAVDIQECEFLDEVDLRYCEFKQVVDFSKCHFKKHFDSGNRGEAHTIYRKDLICRGAEFAGPFDLHGGLIEGSAFFAGAKFLSEKRSVDFGWTSVGETLVFDRTLFKGAADYSNVKCAGTGRFENSSFEGEVDFHGASFGRSLFCGGAIFKAKASFNTLDCEDSAFFDSAMFEGEVDFTRASFGGDLYYREAIFKAKAIFNTPKCGNSAFFNLATFEGEANFVNASFSRSLFCREAIFKKKASFNTLDCEDSAFFDPATFEGEVDFRRASFGGGLYCRGANFERYVTLYQSKIGMLSLGRTLPFGENSRVDLRECQFDRFDGSSKVAKEMAAKQRPEEFSRDPYLQLEKYYRGVGNELEAKRLHYMGRRDLRENAKDKNGRTEWPLLTRWGDWCLKWLTGYGVHTWLLLIPIFFFLGVGTWVFWPSEALVTTPGTHGQSNEGQEANALYLASTGSSQEQSQGGLGQHLFHRVSYSLDLFLPVVNLHIDEDWQPNGLGRQIYAVVHSMVGWILVPLLLASLAGIIRRE